MTTTVLTRYAIKMMTDGELFIHLVDLPCDLKGACRPNADGTYSIFINARYSTESQRETLHHEIAHIYHRDHQRDLDIALIEAMRR